MSSRLDALAGSVTAAARAAAAAEDVPAVLGAALGALRERSSVVAAALLLRSPGGGLRLFREEEPEGLAVGAEAVPLLTAAMLSGRAHEGDSPWPGAPAATSGLALPLLRGEQAIGAVGLASTEPMAGTPGEVYVLAAWADVIAAEVSRLERGQDDAARVAAERDAEALRRFTAIIGSDIDLPRVFGAALAEVRHELGCDAGALFVLDEARDSLRPYASTLEDSAALAALADLSDLPPTDGTSASALALARGETVVVEDTGKGRFSFDARLAELGYRTHLAHPLRRSDQLIGTFNLASRSPRAFSQVPAGMLESVAATLALAVHNALLFERVRASEHLYASLVEEAQDGIYRLDARSRLVFANRACAQLLGVPAAELVGRPWRNLLHPDEERTDLPAPLLAGSHDDVMLELRMATADGQSVLTSHQLHALRDERGALSGVQGIVRDVERERQANRALRLHHELVEGLDDYVFMADTSGRLLAINRKARESLGWDLAEVGEMTIWDLHPPEDKAKVERERWKIVETGASAFEVRLLTRSGKTIPTRGRVTYSPASGTFQGVYRDTTEEQLINERLVQVERLRALGEMASGVAHTFNNLLAVIGTTVQVTKRLAGEGAVLDQLIAIEQTVYDGGAAVRRIQDFVRKRPAETHRELDLGQVAQEVVSIARQRVRARPDPPIEIEAEIGEVRPVRGNEAELRDVLLNLVFNAIDAMPEGGTIRVVTGSVGEHAAVEVTDTGRGMTSEVRSKIFTPFFSTKGERGSGLGLAIALNVVSQHGGSIEVKSAPGHGTTMRVLLPPAPGEGHPGPPARVLLVETEPLLRTQLARAIAREGHTVEAVASGEAALELLEGERFDCVFTDLAMTPVGGLEVADRVRAIGGKAVLLAGWADEVTEAKVRQHGIDAVLRKPFPVGAVLNLIHGLSRRAGAV